MEHLTLEEMEALVVEGEVLEATDIMVVLEQQIKVEMVVVVVTLMDLHLAVVEVVHQEMQTTQFLIMLVVQEKQVYLHQ